LDPGAAEGLCSNQYFCSSSKAAETVPDGAETFWGSPLPIYEKAMTNIA
jgi:hypothetical protein